MKLAPHSLAIAAASAMAAWPLGRVIAGRLFPSSRLLARVGFRTALWSSMTAVCSTPTKSPADCFQVGISQYSSYRHSQLSERLSFCWDVQTRYGMWRFRAPRGLQTEIIKYTFGRWHEMALRRDPEVIDPLELAEFLDATFTCGQFYLEVMCNAEAGNKTIDEALKFYLPSYPRESDGLGLLPNEGRWANPGASQNDGSSRNGIDPQVKDSQRKEKWNWWATKADDEVNAQNGTNSSTKRYP